MNEIKLALIAGNMSIMHLGHYKLIGRASQETDGVVIFVSKNGRENIDGTKVEVLWKEYFEPCLPNNVKINFCEESPIKELYKFIDTNRFKEDHFFTIYSDTNDANKNFNNLSKYFKRLCETNRLNIISVDRNDTCNISGKEIRKFIENNDFQLFKKFLPESVESQKVWDFIKNKPLVDYIKTVLNISTLKF